MVPQLRQGDLCVGGEFDASDPRSTHEQFKADRTPPTSSNSVTELLLVFSRLHHDTRSKLGHDGNTAAAAAKAARRQATVTENPPCRTQRGLRHYSAAQQVKSCGSANDRRHKTGIFRTNDDPDLFLQRPAAFKVCEREKKKRKEGKGIYTSVTRQTGKKMENVAQ